MKGLLGILFYLITLAVLFACFISSLRPIPLKRYARFTGFETQFGEPNEALTLVGAFLFYIRARTGDIMISVICSPDERSEVVTS